MTDAQMNSLCTNGWTPHYVNLLITCKQNNDYLAKVTGRTVKEIEAKKQQIQVILKQPEVIIKPVTDTKAKDRRTVKKKSRKKPVPYSAAEIEDIKNPNMSISDIAAKYGRSYGTVWRKRKELGVEIKPDIPPVKKLNLDPIPAKSSSFDMILEKQELADVELVLKEDIEVITVIKYEMFEKNTPFNKIKINLGKGYNAEKISFLCDCYRSNIKMDKYIADYKADQLKVLKDALEAGVDVNVLADPRIPAEAMQIILNSLKEAE